MTTRSVDWLIENNLKLALSMLEQGKLTAEETEAVQGALNTSMKAGDGMKSCKTRDQLLISVGAVTFLLEALPKEGVH